MATSTSQLSQLHPVGGQERFNQSIRAGKSNYLVSYVHEQTQTNRVE